MQKRYDLIILGSGAGGATLAYALRNSGQKILVVERGKVLPQEPENWDPQAVFQERRYHTRDRWKNAHTGRTILPKEFYWVGGKTKVYGAALLRLRESDFRPMEHHAGRSPAWPIRYADLEPYYDEAEQLYLAHGAAGADPTEPPRAGPYPFPPVPESAYIHRLYERLQAQGLQPFPIPVGIDYRDGGACVYCRTCDGYPCQVQAKADAEVCCLQPALASGHVELMTGTTAERLTVDRHGRINAVHVDRDGESLELHADRYVVACGAIQSAMLLLRSRCDAFPAGLANRSGMVGRNLMFHNATGLVGLHLLRKNTAQFQKTLALHDYYHGDADWPYPMGAVQLLGFYPLQYNGVPWIGRFVNQRSIQFFVLSEDLPDDENRVTIDADGTLSIAYRPNNLESHRQLVKRTKRIFRQAGYGQVFSQFVRQPKDAGAHECGTLRFGRDPQTSVLDSYCRSHDIENLYVVDASFFPSSGAVNPALTVIAQALRVGAHLAD